MASLISIQLSGRPTVDENLQKVEQLIQAACEAADDEKLIVLPECFSIFGVPKAQMLATAEHIESGPIQSFLSDLAIKFNASIVGGTTPILSPFVSSKASLKDGVDDTYQSTSASNTKDTENPERYYASSLVYAPSGKRIARYDKIHLFDVEVNDSTRSYKESASTIAGKHLSTFSIGSTPQTKQHVAQCVCYDLRFTDMFSAYTKCSQGNAPTTIVAPSAFTKKTGAAHWHALLKARSIENQCYIVAANQVGVHADGRETFGNSCIYSPWGECELVKFTNSTTQEGYAISTYDKSSIENIRANMPIQLHKKERYTLG